MRGLEGEKCRRKARQDEVILLLLHLHRLQTAGQHRSRHLSMFPSTPPSQISADEGQEGNRRIIESVKKLLVRTRILRTGTFYRVPMVTERMEMSKN